MLEKESMFDCSKSPRIKTLKSARSIIIGYKEKYGEAIVTTGVPVELKKGEVSYKRVKEETYEEYMTRQLRKRS